MGTPSSLQGKTVRELRDMARRDAQAVLDVHWSDRSIPVEPIPIARSLGASVFLAELGDDVYGMIQGDPAGANIYVDLDSAPVRQRFTVAHEVGHMVSYQGELLNPDEGFVDKRSDATVGTASEVYANEFAGELLMPEEQLRAAINRGLNNFALASYFNVSVQSLTYRRQLLHI